MDFNNVEQIDEDAGYIVEWTEDQTTGRPEHFVRILSDVPQQHIITANDS